MRQTPIDILQKAILYSGLATARDGPGQVILALNQQDRALLTELTSSSLEKLRVTSDDLANAESWAGKKFAWRWNG